MTTILLNPTRLILCFTGTIIIIFGLYLKGVFHKRRYRKTLFQCCISIVAGAIILLLMGATTGTINFPAEKVEGFLITPAINTGQLLALWFPAHSHPVGIFFIALILVTSLSTFLLKRNQAYSFILLIFALGAGWVGGWYLGQRELQPAYFFLGFSFLYGVISCLWDKTSNRDRTNWLAATVILILIILLGFFLRSYELGTISYRFDHYESDYGRETLAVLSGYHNIELWNSTIWRGLGHLNYSPVYIYYTALFFILFGSSLVTLKIVAVSWGILAILLTYGIISNLFSRRLALITAFLLAVSPLHINYSRIGLLLISTQTVSLLVIYFLLRAIIRGKLISYILLGITLSFAGYFYSPAKYPILITAILIVSYSIFKRKWFRRNLLGIILLFFTVIVLMTALNIPALDIMAPRFAGYESVWHRTRDHQYMPQADYLRGIPLVWENLKALIDSFFINRNFNYDPWPRGNLYFNPIIPPLFLLGVAISLFKIRQTNYRLLLFFTAAFLLPNLLSRPPVMVRRMMVSWPFIFCLAAIPLSQLLIKAKELGGKVGSGLSVIPVLAVLLLAGSYNCNIFFNSQTPAGRWEEERYYDEYAKNLINEYHLLLVPINNLSRKTINFILNETKGSVGRGFEYLTPERAKNLSWESISARMPVAIICAAGQLSRSDLEKLRRRFGRGRIEEFRDKFGRLRAITLFID